MLLRAHSERVDAASVFRGPGPSSQQGPVQNADTQSNRDARGGPHSCDVTDQIQHTRSQDHQVQGKVSGTEKGFFAGGGAPRFNFHKFSKDLVSEVGTPTRSIDDSKSYLGRLHSLLEDFRARS